jgi:hypothetical protein
MRVHVFMVWLLINLIMYFVEENGVVIKRFGEVYVVNIVWVRDKGYRNLSGVKRNKFVNNSVIVSFVC